MKTTQEAVKELLDKDCSASLQNELKRTIKRRHKTDEWYVRMDFWEAHEYCDHKAESNKCWQCHKHDALSARIAEAVKEQK